MVVRKPSSPSSVWLGFTLNTTVGPALLSFCTAWACGRSCRGCPFTARISSPSRRWLAERLRSSAYSPWTPQVLDYCALRKFLFISLPAAPFSLIHDTTMGMPCSFPPLTLKSRPLFLRCSLTVFVPRALFMSVVLRTTRAPPTFSGHLLGNVWRFTWAGGRFKTQKSTRHGIS